MPNQTRQLLSQAVREEITTPMGLRIWKRRVQKATIQIDSSENFTKTSLIPTKYLQKTDKKL